MMIDLERCAAAATAQVKKLSPRTYMVEGVVVRILCTRCRFERSHPCWKVTLTQNPSIDFLIWARADQLNEQIERLYLLPVSDFPTHTYLWPSTRTLQAYEQYAYPSLAAMFGL